MTLGGSWSKEAKLLPISRGVRGLSPRPTCALEKLIHKVFKGAGAGQEAGYSVEVVEGNQDVLGVPCHVHHLVDRALSFRPPQLL